MTKDGAVKKAFDKLFGDMYLSESETALRIFEYGYKAGVAAENEACAKVCDELRGGDETEQEPVAWISADTLKLDHIIKATIQVCRREPDEYYNVPLYTAPPSKSEQEPVAWTKVSDKLPKSGVIVLACYKNRLGKLRCIRAHWVAAKTVETSVDYGECFEYDEETDEYYLPEGWYECMDNWDEYSSVAVCEGEITHWMPLPPAPNEKCTTPPSKPWVSLTDEAIDGFRSGYQSGRIGTFVELARAIEAKLKEKNSGL